MKFKGLIERVMIRVKTNVEMLCIINCDGEVGDDAGKGLIILWLLSHFVYHALMMHPFLLDNALRCFKIFFSLSCFVLLGSQIFLLSRFL
jgi:hypothetical protein